MSVIVDVIINTDQAEQQLQDLQQQIASDLAQGAARIGTTAGQAATATARAAGKNATEEFLRAFDPDKLRAELESAGLDEQQIEIILETTAAKAETQKLKDTIASAFGEASGFATDALKQITAQAAREVDRAAGKVKSVTEIVDGVRDLKDELKQVGGASDEAAAGIGMLVLNETVDKFGDLKDIFEKTGVALFGLSQEAVDAAVKVADIAEKGAMVGAAFGPIGAAAGLGIGAIVGMFNAAAESEIKLREQIKEQQETLAETEEFVVNLRESYQRLGDVSFDAILKSLDEIDKKQKELEDTPRQTQEQIRLYVKELLALDEAKNESLQAGVEKLSDTTLKVLTDINGALNKEQAPKTLQKLQEEAEDARYELIETQKKLGAFYNSLKPPAGLVSAFPVLSDAINKIGLIASGKQLADLAGKAEEGTKKLADAEGALASATKKSSAASSTRKQEIEAGIRTAKGALTPYGELIELEEKHAQTMKNRAETALDLTDFIIDLEKDLQKSREEDLKLADEQAAKEKAINDQRKKSAEDLAKAQVEAAKANTEAYKQILQPYADFVGTVFGTFVQGLAEGQSATEAFAQGVRQAVAAALGALAKEFGVKSLGALAEGFAALSNPFTAAAAPGFFKSAALYAAAAAAAGAGSAFVSSAGGGAGGSVPNVGGGAGVSASSGGVGGTGNSLGGSSQQSAGTPGSIVVDLRGAVFPTSDLTGAQQFGEAVARSLAAASAGNQPMARRLIGTRGFVV